MVAFKTWSVVGLAAVLTFATGLSLYSLGRERRHTAELAASNQSLGATLSQVQGQLDSVSRKLTEIETQRAETQHATPVRTEAARAAVRVPRQAARPIDDPRINQLKAQLSEQEKEIASAKEEINSARDQIQQTQGDLQGKLNASHDELSGSIARTHDELVELQKRGERNYYEFQMDKSKQFQKVGPISVSLRKANIKRKSYDLAMLVDDVQIQKKSVNLFEPVWISIEDRPQPLELVVNQVHKDQIAGYLSEPKFRSAANLGKAPADKSAPSEKSIIDKLAPSDPRRD
jgi:hypothetical protein